MQSDIWNDYNSLPIDAQRQVADFIAFLRQRQSHAEPKRSRRADWEDEPFVGMWRDRNDMADSTAWVRRTRRQEWGESLG